MPHVALVSLFEVVLLLGNCLAAFRLLLEGLVHRYPFFFAYLIFRIPVTAGSLLLNPKSHAYFYFWIFTTPLHWVLFLLVVRELYGLVLARHKGLYTLGRWIIYAGIAVAVGISIISLLPKFAPASQKSSIIVYFYAVDRAVDLSLATFLLLMLLLLSQYLAYLSKNVVTHAILFAVLVLCNSIGTILRNYLGFKSFPLLETIRMGQWALCSLGWFFLIRAKGEQPRHAVPTLELKHERRMMSQLDALNETLLNAGKK